jgi:hypothetical protein
MCFLTQQERKKIVAFEHMDSKPAEREVNARYVAFRRAPVIWDNAVPFVDNARQLGKRLAAASPNFYINGVLGPGLIEVLLNRSVRCIQRGEELFTALVELRIIAVFDDGTFSTPVPGIPELERVLSTGAFLANFKLLPYTAEA